MADKDLTNNDVHNGRRMFRMDVVSDLITPPPSSDSRLYEAALFVEGDSKDAEATDAAQPALRCPRGPSGAADFPSPPLQRG